MQWQPFAEAFVATRFTVMGRRLRPFCAYYQFWLELVESPLWVGGRAANAVDLELASLICSAAYGEVETVLADFERRSWWQRCRWRGWGQWRWALRALCCRPERQAAAFQAYLRANYSPPEFHPSKAGRRANDEFPPVLGAVCAMIEMSGWHEAMVWTLPLGRLHWYVTGHIRNKGVELKMVTDRDRAERELHNSIITAAEAKAGRKLTPEEKAAAYREWIKEQLKTQSSKVKTTTQEPKTTPTNFEI
jgi:hypothetical protein